MVVWRSLESCLQAQLSVVLYQVLSGRYILEAGVKNLKFRYEFSGEGDEMRVEETKLLPVLGRLELFLQTRKIFFGPNKNDDINEFKLSF